MFAGTAEFYDAIYGFIDYAADARRLHDLIQTLRPGSRTLLDVACGTGRHLEQLQEHYDVEGLDLSERLLVGARRRCPTAMLHRGDMREFEVGRRFDVVTCLFSAVAYLPDAPALAQAVQTMARHLAPGGLLIVEPWFTPETYWVDRLTVNALNSDAYKGVWMYVSKRFDQRAVLDIHYLIGGVNGIEYFVERHDLALFGRGEIMASFEIARCKAQYDAVGLRGRGLYVGVLDTNV